MAIQRPAIERSSLRPSRRLRTLGRRMCRGETGD